MLEHELSSSKPACIKVRANKKFRSLFELLSSEAESRGSEADLLLEDASQLMGAIFDPSSFDDYLSMLAAAFASGKAQKTVCKMRPARAIGDLASFSVAVQLLITTVEGRVKIVHTFTNLSGL